MTERSLYLARYRRAVAAVVRGRARVRELPGGALAVRALVTLLGVGVIVLGIVLLPLPGPGWLIIFTGLGILATEYDWAARLLRRARHYVESWTRWGMRQTLFVRALIGLGGLALIGAVMAASWLLLV